MAFCDYCDCLDCQNGTELISHALTTDDGKWICDICFSYDVCISIKRTLGIVGGPCGNMDCEHRPKLIGEWEKL